MSQYNDQFSAVLSRLVKSIDERKGAEPGSSYTASLFAGGVEKCAKKFGEESFELALAAASGDKSHTAEEAADVLYHYLVLLGVSGVDLDDVGQILAKREGMSGHEEKASRLK
ncbi:phosphoribosyl-ATP diphosphatase [Hyphococcus formosus]|uniref:phosphoribosyl-ATP diphosphatase n=1 Tax=Hyphococcus formosus TaxID=3143534 RepID=UPI00398B44AB